MSAALGRLSQLAFLSRRSASSTSSGCRRLRAHAARPVSDGAEGLDEEVTFSPTTCSSSFRVPVGCSTTSRRSPSSGSGSTRRICSRGRLATTSCAATCGGHLKRPRSEVELPPQAGELQAQGKTVAVVGPAARKGRLPKEPPAQSRRRTLSPRCPGGVQRSGARTTGPRWRGSARRRAQTRPVHWAQGRS